MQTARPTTAVDPAATRRRRWLADHRAFVVALLLGSTVRVVVSVAFTPAFIFSDGPTYLSFLETFEPHPDRPVGYGLLVLLPLAWLTEQVLWVAVAQHLMGLVSATVLYLLLRRWGVRPRVATLAALPVLFDTSQLVLEHSILSDALFQLLVLSAVALLGWRRRPTPALAVAAGVVLGVTVTVRLVGEPLVIAAVAFCLLTGTGWRGRVTTASAVLVGFLLPVGAYATWYHQENGVYALSEFSGKSLYVRATSFVDCPQLSVPDYQRVLCPVEPRGERRDPTFYLWHDPRTLPSLDLPTGTTQDEALRAFALAAIRAQPADYTAIVARDFALNFDIWRGDRFEYETAYKWRFDHYVDLGPTDWTGPAYAEHGGDQLTTRQPYANALVGYQWVGYLPGPLLLGCLVLGLVGGLGAGRARDSGMRLVCLLPTVSGAGLLLVPDLTAEFTWRYQLPALVLLPMGAALGFAALRGVTATPGSARRPAPTDRTAPVPAAPAPWWPER